MTSKLSRQYQEQKSQYLKEEHRGEMKSNLKMKLNDFKGLPELPKEIKVGERFVPESLSEQKERLRKGGLATYYIIIKVKGKGKSYEYKPEMVYIE